MLDYFSWARALKDQVPESVFDQHQPHHPGGRRGRSASSANGVQMKTLFTAIVAGTEYLLHPQILDTIEETIKPDALIPVTLLDTSEIFGDLDGILRLLDAVDDVFQPDFGTVLVEKPAKNDSSNVINSNSTTTSNSSVVGAAYTLASPEFQAAGLQDLPSGPYFLQGPNLHQAWRLYDDDLDAFAVGVIPESIDGSSDVFDALFSMSDDGLSKATIAVPSRLYHPAPSIHKPLSGIRMSITDAMSLKGVQTTLSSKSWASLYNTDAASTSDFAQKLIDMGAIVVGKTKSSQFDSGREWVDVTAPKNPRGDGVQDPSWSAAGAGAGLAGYTWMQYSVAQDALEGVRRQSGVHGLYSLRSSAGGASLNGWQISSPHYDTAGLLSRDLNDLLKLAGSTLNVSNTDISLPNRLIYPLDFYPIASKEHQELDGKFVGTLEKLLGVKAEKIRLSEIWDEEPPTEADGQGLQEFMNKAPFGSFCYEFFHEYDAFRNSYRSKFDREPDVEATVLFRWSVGENETQEEYNAYVKRIDVFRRWFDDKVMSTAAGSRTAMILPFGTDQPKYRDDPPGKPTAVDGVTSELLAPLLETPQLVVPFAQLPYHSRFSNKTEQHPICGSVMGPRGSDVMLIQMVKRAFDKARWRTRVDTGRLTFPENYKPA